jgi:hypothetical protein
MHISTGVRGVPFATATAGNIIRIFGKDNKLYTGMKVYRENYKAALYLQSHPIFGMAEIAEWHEEQGLILEAPEAVLLCNEFTQMPYGHAPATGDLAIHDDGKTTLLAKMNDSPWYVDMGTGQLFLPNEGRKPTIKVSKWSIVLKADTKECLVEFPSLCKSSQVQRPT